METKEMEADVQGYMSTDTGDFYLVRTNRWQMSRFLFWPTPWGVLITASKQPKTLGDFGELDSEASIEYAWYELVVLLINGVVGIFIKNYTGKQQDERNDCS